ncbi:hypothetical protein L2E82_08251 [Cichorium intybus]|uniref:Uncharacterized protein n=1 Tax=Cichorium intybus TaxID=13427 RepID=A0ACB9G731_CICIN|nr:hypothetical protein L2E82_08251 [Cichorium intybus]
MHWTETDVNEARAVRFRIQPCNESNRDVQIKDFGSRCCISDQFLFFKLLMYGGVMIVDQILRLTRDGHTRLTRDGHTNGLTYNSL